MERAESFISHHAHVILMACENPITLYLGALALFVLGSFIISRTPIYSVSGGSEYERKRILRAVGVLLIVCSPVVAAIKYYSSLAAVNEPVVLKSVVQVQGPVYSSPVSSVTLINPALSSSDSHDLLPKSDLSSDQVNVLLRETLRLLQQKKIDLALKAINTALQASPQNAAAYALRGNIYAEMKLWTKAQSDYQANLKLGGSNIEVKFDLAEISFLQKNYDAARPNFSALVRDSNLGDLASYKTFLCDLFGGHDDVAAYELDEYNRIGSNASYYFANAAWSLYHKKTEDARSWLMSASRIYAPNKFRLYASSLINLGYMPLPPPPTTP